MEELYTYVRRTWKERLFTFPWQPWRKLRRVRDFRAEEARDRAYLNSEREIDRILRVADDVSPTFENTLALGLLMAEAVGPYGQENDPWLNPQPAPAISQNVVENSRSDGIVFVSPKSADFDASSDSNGFESRSERQMPNESWQNSSLDPSGVPCGDESQTASSDASR